MQIRLVKMTGAYSKSFNISLFWYYIKLYSAVASLNETFHLLPHENILTIALINIHYLYTSQ